MTAAKSPWVAGLTASFLPWLDTDIVGNSVMYAYGRVAQSPVFEGKRGKLNIFLLLHVISRRPVRIYEVVGALTLNFVSHLANGGTVIS